MAIRFLSPLVAKKRATHRKGEEMMNTRLMNNLKNAAACSILISSFSAASVRAEQTDALFLSRPPSAAIPVPGATPRAFQRNIPLKLDQKGDLLIQCGSARFSVAYNEPADQLKPSEQQQFKQREHNSIINGISLTASLPF
jgi:hypothetical protein